MRTVFLTMATAVFVFIIGASSFAEEITLKGELLEVSCFQKLGLEKATGPGHLTCAKDCAKKGLTLGILTDGDGVFKIVGTYAADNNAKLMDLIGKQVEATGNKEKTPDYSTAIRVAKISVAKKGS